MSYNKIVRISRKKCMIIAKKRNLTLTSNTKNLPRNTAFKFIILLGIVSLFSDMVYEGARSIVGPYFALLGASGAIVGFVAGFGELAGNVLRVISGYLLDK